MPAPETALPQKWPDVLWIVRHGESVGNVARRRANFAREKVIDLPMRDVDVPLSPLGEQQATALGQWFGEMPPERRPTVVLTSPYVRTMQTAELIIRASGIDPLDHTFVVDERLREKEFGILDRLTRHGIEHHYPEQWELRRHVGKFYYRPPGGESWPDVILRLRSVIDTLTRDYARERVLVVCHQVVVLCWRYLLERLTEQQVLQIDRSTELANCSVTSYEFDRSLGRNGKLALRTFNFVAPLQDARTPITAEPSPGVGQP